jgi:hypothetical protein
MNKKEKWAAFKASCRVYKSEKTTLSLYHSNGQGDEMFYSFLEDDIHFVESTFQDIDDKCGTSAKVMIWLLCVEGKSQIEVAEKYGLTRRALQVSLYKWIDEVFEDDDE